MKDKCFRYYVIYIVLYLMLYFVLVYECVLAQMLSAKSGVLSVNRLSNHLFPTVHMRSFCCGSPAFLSSVPVCAQTQSFCVCKYTMFFYCYDSLGSEKEFCACSIYTAVCIFVI